mgnify:CR=1 FL=1
MLITKKIEFSIKNSYQKTKIERELHRHTHVTVAARYQYMFVETNPVQKKKRFSKKRGPKQNNMMNSHYSM